MRDLVHVERANDVALFFDDSFREIAPQKLSHVDPNGIPVLERRGRAHGSIAHQNRAIRLNYLQEAHPLVVIAKNLQQHVAARAGRKQNIVGFKPTGLVGDQIFGFRGF